MAINKDQIKDLLGSGLSNELVASAVGCDPSYISQLMSDDTFAEGVLQLRLTALKGASERDRGIDAIEARLIDKLDAVTEQIYKPKDVLHAFRVLNDAKRRGVAPTDGLRPRQQIVALMIPKIVINKFVTSSENEVIEVAGQTLVTKSSTELLRELAAKGGEGAEEYTKALSYLPGSVGGTGGGSGAIPFGEAVKESGSNALSKGGAFLPTGGKGYGDTAVEGNG